MAQTLRLIVCCALSQSVWIGATLGQQGGDGKPTSTSANPGVALIEKVSPKLRKMAEAGGVLPVFIVLRSQPHREILERVEAPSQLRIDMLQARYSDLENRAFVAGEELREARTAWERAMLEARQAAFREIEAVIGPEQEAVERLLLNLGATNIRRYSAINMLAAEVPASALAALEAEPLVREVAPIETLSAQLDVSVPSLGAPFFWNGGYRGFGQSVAVLDTGIRTTHPAFTGLSIVSRVFLESGSNDSACFGDDATSPEDRQGHGTHVAGIVASRGAPGWAQYLGVAPGLGTLYNLKVAYRNTCTTPPGGGTLKGSDVDAALDWAVQQTPWVKVFNYSAGTSDTDQTSGGDGPLARRFDYLADTYGLTIAVSAGNDGWSLFGFFEPSKVVTSPGIAYNVLTVAAMNTQRTGDRSDDSVAAQSSRGPTLDQRKKPDIAAPGGARDNFWGTEWAEGIYSTAFDSNGFLPLAGTSMAAPHIAGAAALLRNAGVQDPLAIKALLLNTTDRLDWRNDWGWGYANLARTFAQRGNVVVESLPFNRVRLYKGAGNGQFYSTLTWNRSVFASLTGSCLSGLDLAVYNGSTGSLLGASASSEDNVEKAYTTFNGPLVVTVSHGGTSCRSPEPFALALSESGFASATGALLAASCSAPSTVAPGAKVTVTCTVRNSGDLPAFSVAGPLNFLGGTGGAAQDFGTIVPNGSSVRSWLVTAPASGSFSLRLEVKSESFGALFSAAGDVTSSVGTPTCTFTVRPTSVSMPASGGGATVSVTSGTGCTWSAVSNVPWITVNTGTSGSGNGTVVFTVAANGSPVARTGTLTVALQTVSVTQAASPNLSISAVVNAASYAAGGLPNGGIAQGSLFVVFGTSLGPATLQQSGLPLRTILAGTSIRVTPTAGGAPVDALMFYTSARQVAAILPSNTPEGGANLTVTYNGPTSAPVLIKVVRSALGVFARNQAGSGPAIIQNYKSVTDQPVNSILDPARPGQVMILWGTGLGPVDFDETTQPQVKDLPVATEVLVGGKSAKVLYHGRSPQFPGIDQINFQIPDDAPQGCYVPVAVRAGGVVSNFTSIAVSSSGNVCTDPHGFPEADLERIRAGEKLGIGWVQVFRLNIKLSNYPGIGPLDGGVDFGIGDFFRWDAATAVQSAGVNAGAGIPMGTCAVYPVPPKGPFVIGAPRPQRMNAGAALALSGPNGTKSIPRRPGSGLYDKQPLGAWAPGVPLPPGFAKYLDPGLYGLNNGAGGVDVGTIIAAGAIPDPPTWTNAGDVSTIDRSQDLLVTWSGGNADREYVVIAGGVFIPDLPSMQVGAMFTCTERTAAGRFTVPAAILSAMPAGSGANATPLLGVGSAPLLTPRRFTARGVDVGYFTYMVFNAKDVTYK